MNYRNITRTLVLIAALGVLHPCITAKAEMENAAVEETSVTSNVIVAGQVSAGNEMIAKADLAAAPEMIKITELSQHTFSTTELATDLQQFNKKVTDKQAQAQARSYTEEELYILAHVICGEAQSYSDQEQLYVGSVVLNRVNHSRYPNSLHGVVFQKGQYSCTRDGNYYRQPTERNWANARYLLENGSVLPANVVFQSGGRQGHGVYVKTSRHYYCYY